jgi:hypothetical protein
MMKRWFSGFAVALTLAGTGTLLSCGGSPTSPSQCTLGPYTYDANVQRCRASNGQFADNACCGR